MVMDEPLTHLDRTGRARVGMMLKNLMRNGENSGHLATQGLSAKTILLILQDLSAEEVEESFDRIDEVVREGGFSIVNVDEYS